MLGSSMHGVFSVEHMDDCKLTAEKQREETLVMKSKIN